MLFVNILKPRVPAPVSVMFHRLAASLRVALKKKGELALNLAQYQAMYGELPADEYVSLAAVDSLTPELAKTLADGMEILVGLMGSLPGHDQDDDSVH